MKRYHRNRLKNMYETLKEGVQKGLSFIILNTCLAIGGFAGLGANYIIINGISSEDKKSEIVSKDNQMYQRRQDDITEYSPGIVIGGLAGLLAWAVISDRLFGPLWGGGKSREGHGLADGGPGDFG